MLRPKRRIPSTMPLCKEISPSRTSCVSWVVNRATCSLAPSMKTMSLLIVRLRANAVVAKTSTTLPLMLKMTKRQTEGNLAWLKKTKIMMTILLLSKSKRKKRNSYALRLRRKGRNRRRHRPSVVPNLLKLNASVRKLKQLKSLPASKQTKKRNVSINFRSKKNCSA